MRIFARVPSERGRQVQ